MPADIFHLLVKKPFLLKEQLRTQMSTELEQRRGVISCSKIRVDGRLIWGIWWHEKSFAQEYVNDGRNIEYVSCISCKLFTSKISFAFVRQ